MTGFNYFFRKKVGIYLVQSNKCYIFVYKILTIKKKKMKSIKEIKKGSYVLKIYYDDDPENPRDYENLGTMVCFHRRYNLGDKHNYNPSYYKHFGELKKDICKNVNVGVILPLYLYDHSGITMNTTEFNCVWDSGQVGFIFISKENILKNFGGKILTKKLKERVTNYLIDEVKIYDSYLTGNVFGFKVFKVTECELKHKHETLLDSCWGFFSEDSCVLDGLNIINDYIENEVVSDEDFSDMLHSVDKN